MSESKKQNTYIIEALTIANRAIEQSFSKTLYKQDIYGGVFSIEPRDVSYWNPENGPNREDRYAMFFTYNGKKFSIGSHPRLAKQYAKNKGQESLFKYLSLIYPNFKGGE